MITQSYDISEIEISEIKTPDSFDKQTHDFSRTLNMVLRTGERVSIILYAKNMPSLMIPLSNKLV